MLSHILLAERKILTISVGGILKAIHGNIRVGGSEVFVTEACEIYKQLPSLLPEDQYHPEYRGRPYGLL